MPLTGPQIGRIHKAILAAYTRKELTRVLLVCMDIEFDNVVEPDDFSAQVFELVRWADKRERAIELLKFAYEENPTAALRALYDEAQNWVTPVGDMPHRTHLAPSAVLHQRYVIERRLGEGQMGAVYLARDTSAFNRRCAVKETLPHGIVATRSEAERFFENEARMLATMRIDGLPQIYEFFIEQGRYYFVMEYLEGDNLAQLAAKRGGRLPLYEALTYGLQLANILTALAKLAPPIIHRDVKPINIIFDADLNRVKLVDFGAAVKYAASGATTAPYPAFGTPGYAPPEQYTNQVEPRTDIYALGATLHQLITGRDPTLELFTFPPVTQFVPETRHEIADFLARMTAPKVADRPTAAEVRDAFSVFLLV